MFTYCPTPLPDELLSGVFARLMDIVQYPRNSDFSIAIYGCERQSISFIFPGYLDNIVASLPLGHPYPVDRLIREHTLFPFFEPFLSAKRGQRLRDGMRESNELKTYNCLGISGSIIPTPRWLRFCYECVQEDKMEHKIIYWHRVHQVPGVKVCPKHGTILQESSVSTTQPAGKDLYVSAQRALKTVEPVLNHFADPAHQILLRIAKDAYWLLCQNSTAVTLESLRDRLRIVMVNKGLITYRDVVRRARFLKEFQDFYPAELFSLLDCPLNDTGSSPWPIEAVNTTRTKHPIQYLLIIYFLGYTLESFFALPRETSYFGQKPWPCLNPACQNYRQAVIDTYQPNNLPSVPRAIFACTTCGFTYRRIGPDSGKEDRFRVDSVLTRGPIWEASLQEMLDDSALKIGDIAQRLNIDKGTLTKYLVENGLGSLSTDNESHQDQSIFPSQVKNQEEYRALWEEAYKKFPEAKVSELTIDPILRRAKCWLLKHDREWYEENKPETKRHKPNKIGRSPKYLARDRRNLDIQLAEKICLAATELVKQTGKPIRITQKAICSRLDQLNCFTKLKRSPLARKTLSAFIESYEVYAIRMVEWWVAKYYQERGALPTKSELVKLTNFTTFFRNQKWAELSEQVLENLAPWDTQALSLVYTLLPTAQKNWALLDAQLPNLIEEAAGQIKAELGYPTRVTAVTLGVNIDKLEEVTRDLEWLPQVARTLAKVVETDEDFGTRVIDWIIANDPEAITCHNRLEFVKLTGLQIYEKIPAITALIDAAFMKLQTGSASKREATKNWLERDKKLALAIRDAASVLRSRSDPFIRVTKKAICQMIDSSDLGVSIEHLIERCLDKLPETRETLNNMIESQEQFAGRRLYEVAEQFRQKGIRPTRRQLSRSAHIELYVSPQVKQIANTLLESLAALPSESEIADKKKWEERDTLLANSVKKIAEQLKERYAPFVWVTREAISKHLGLSSELFSRNRDKLPKTVEILKQVTETAEEYAIRRVRRVEAHYQKLKVCPSRYRFIKDVGLGCDITNPHIHEIISEALQNLASFPTVQEIDKLKRWERVDIELSQLIKPAAEKLKNRTKPLVWVNRSSISKFIGKYSYIHQNLRRMPKTAEALAQAEETSEEYAIRRIRWVEAYYQEIKACPSRSRFIAETGLSGMIKRPQIQKVVMEVLQTLALVQTTNEHECKVEPKGK